jgi:hypothetical protein
LHRTFWQRFIYKAIRECRDCKARITEPRRFTFRFMRRARCPECGARTLRQFSGRDPIERMTHHPLSLLQGLLGGHLYFCPLCRLQFYDWRRLSQEQLPSPAVYEPVPD